jgi:hypothetical protein
LKVTVTARERFTVSTHRVAVPEQPLTQPPTTEPESGFAVSVTRVPARVCSLHFDGQEMPAGCETTSPLPCTTTVRVTFGTADDALAQATPRATASPPAIHSLSRMPTTTSLFRFPTTTSPFRFP